MAREKGSGRGFVEGLEGLKIAAGLRVVGREFEDAVEGFQEGGDIALDTLGIGLLAVEVQGGALSEVVDQTVAGGLSGLMCGQRTVGVLQFQSQFPG